VPPHLPLIGVSRSQSLRIGRGPGSAVVPPFNMGDTATNPDTGGLYSLFYADMGNAQVRRDIQHHAAEGAIETVAGAASLSVWSDLYRLSTTGLVVAAGTTYTLSVTPQTTSLAAPQIASRFYGLTATLPVTQPDGTALGAGTNLTKLALATPGVTSGINDRYDQVFVTPMGNLGLLTGGSGTPTVNAAFTLTAVGTPAAGTFKIAFNYNGYPYVTASIAFGATGAAVATAMGIATGGPLLPTAAFTGSGTTLPATTTITTANVLGGSFSNVAITENAMTASTGYTVAQTIAGSGPAPFIPGGTNLPLANIFVPGAAANAAACTILNITLTS
jgi:hypothetical protein